VAEVHIGLGSNVGDRAEHLRRALHALRGVVEIERVSSLWETEPVGVREQPDFLNAVVCGRTERPARALLATLVDIEGRLGRVRREPNGPRTIDLDLLAYGGECIDEPGLVLPHPRMSVRRFVLAPLAEISPDLRMRPGGPSAAELLSALPPAEAAERYPCAGWPPPLG
jgi:2-amino-4-hydroxy-6-hydroxymethyldihydropteridine diphosphokinase